MTRCSELADIEWLHRRRSRRGFSPNFRRKHGPAAFRGCPAPANFHGRTNAPAAGTSRSPPPGAAESLPILRKMFFMRGRTRTSDRRMDRTLQDGATHLTTRRPFSNLHHHPSPQTSAAASAATFFHARRPKHPSKAHWPLDDLAKIPQNRGPDLRPRSRDPTAATSSLNKDRKTLHTNISTFDGVDAWHIDPDRRATGRRTTNLASTTSPMSRPIDQLLARCPNGAVKLAPATKVPQHWSDSCELEWISRDRECKQLVAWHGNLACNAGSVRATAISSASGSAPRSVTVAAELSACHHVAYRPLCV